MRTHRLCPAALLAGFLAPSLLPANGVLPETYPDAERINRGREIFLRETFGGNGRTCATCHREDNNFTIDPAYIARLPARDPLFVAERRPPNPLADLENPTMLREAGLILVNSNGFDNGHVFRSVPHLLALRTSITPPSPAAADGTTVPPVDRTGWSGDGSPVDPDADPPRFGSLRDFAIGAVVQHMTRTLGRVPGVDFRLPTEEELDALEAFMLSLGRQEEFDDFRRIRMRDPRAERGRRNYLGEGLAGGVPCNACHFNGGANTDPDFDFPPEITPPAFEASNRSFAPRIEELLDQHGDLLGEDNPFDDGFGRHTDLFNVPPVIEAADTGPFFHANQIDTVEGLVAFYATQRHLRDGTVLPPIVGLNGAQVVNVAAFLRVLNADENARQAIALLRQALGVRRWRDMRTNLRLARAEIRDAIEVLEGARLHATDAVPRLRKAHRLARSVYKAERAIRLLEKVRELLIDREGA